METAIMENPTATGIRPWKVEQGRRIARYSAAELERLLDAAIDRMLEAMDLNMNSHDELRV